MRNLSIVFASLLTLAFVFSCKPAQKKATTDGKPVTLETRTIQQNKGTDCDKEPDTLRKDCAIVDIEAPKIGGTTPLAKNLDAWVDMYLLHQINWAIASEDGTEPKTVEEGIQRFFANHAENAGSVSSGQYSLTCGYDELLNDGTYLTLMLNGYAFTGGNRVLDDVAIASFDVKTGKQLTWDDLVNDQKSLLPIAQAMVQEKRADAFKEGFAFDKQEPFALPTAFGLTAEGIMMHYSSGEIYQLGGTTEFTIPFSEIGTNLKVVAPAAPEVEVSEVDVNELYQITGDSVTIPTFEIEVRESSQAALDMKKRKETIVVSALFNGYPISEKDAGEIGTLDFLNKDIELTGTNRIARFEGLKFPKSVLDKLKDKDISLLINAYSGRKSSVNNLLNCGIVDAKASTFKNRRFLVGCAMIAEDTLGAVLPTVPFALPEAGTKDPKSLPIVVDCSERGDISFAGTPMKDIDELKSALRNVLVYLKQSGSKTIPEIKTDGCLMGMQGAIRDVYEELKSEKTGSKPSSTKAAETATEKTKATEKAAETATEKAKTTEKSAQKPATPSAKTTSAKPAKASAPNITLNEKGDMSLDGKKVATFEELRKQLQAKLLTYDVIPDDLPIQTSGTTGMGARGEMKTQIADAIKGAKWLRKKAAIAALNTAVGKKLDGETQLELGTYQTSGNFAYISAKPKQTDGKPIDYSKTGQAKLPNFVDNVVGLLQYDKGTWKVLTYNLGTAKAPVDAWVKNYKAPKALFGK